MGIVTIDDRQVAVVTLARALAPRFGPAAVFQAAARCAQGHDDTWLRTERKAAILPRLPSTPCRQCLREAAAGLLTRQGWPMPVAQTGSDAARWRAARRKREGMLAQHPDPAWLLPTGEPLPLLEPAHFWPLFESWKGTEWRYQGWRDGVVEYFRLERRIDPLPLPVFGEGRTVRDAAADAWIQVVSAKAFQS